MAKRKDLRKERKRKRRNEKLRRRKHDGRDRPHPRGGFAFDRQNTDWSDFIDEDDGASLAVPTGAPPQPDGFDMERIFLAMEGLGEEDVPAEDGDPMERLAATMLGDRWRRHYADLLRDDPRAQARELAWRAQGQDRHVEDAREMARRALEWDPDCCEALAILAYDFSDLDPDDPAADPVIGLGAAVAAGYRALGGEEFFRQHAGSFWEVASTRSYVRTRCTLAAELVAAGRLTEAAGHYQALRRLAPRRPEDFAGRLAACLLGTGDAAGLAVLLEELAAAADEDGPPGLADLWSGWAEVGLHLITGEKQAAVTALFAADGDNPYVGRLFTLSSSRRPEFTGHLGEAADEAALVAEILGPGFDRVPGMQGFLRQQLALR